MEVLMDYDIVNFKTPGRRPYDSAPIEKLPVHFTIKDKQKAIDCYLRFNEDRTLVEGARYKIYL